jgi:hypothetical protein
MFLQDHEEVTEWLTHMNGDKDQAPALTQEVVAK